MLRFVFLPTLFNSVECTQLGNKQAEKAAPQEAVYPSNLSAALYELGDYPGCFQAICRATNNCPDSEANSNLLSRLSLRLAKTLAHGVRRGDISPQSIQDGSTVLERLKKSADAGSSTNTDLVRAWNDWKRVEDETETVAKGAASARTRLSQLPIFRKGSCVDTCRLRLDNAHLRTISIAIRR